eukprot:1066513-Amphidinium_carterae.1
MAVVTYLMPSWKVKFPEVLKSGWCVSSTSRHGRMSYGRTADGRRCAGRSRAMCGYLLQWANMLPGAGLYAPFDVTLMDEVPTTEGAALSKGHQPLNHKQNEEGEEEEQQQPQSEEQRESPNGSVAGLELPQQQQVPPDFHSCAVGIADSLKTWASALSSPCLKS